MGSSLESELTQRKQAFEDQKQAILEAEKKLTDSFSNISQQALAQSADDLVEEIARVYGYNGFANTLPTPAEVIAHPTARAEHAVRNRLYALGFSEAISSTFASAAESAFFAPSTPAVPLENPLSEEAANLRPSLLPGMVTMLGHNLNRDVLTARLFESGAIFTGSTAQVDESVSLCLGLTATHAATPLYSAADAPFFELKGAIESLLSLFEAPVAAFTRDSIPAGFESSRAASVLVGGKPIAHFGQLSLTEATRRKLRQPVYLGELNLAALMTFPLRQTTARELSRFQAVERDFSFTFADAVPWRTIADAVHALDLPELTRLVPVEIFRDTKAGSASAGKYALLLRCVFQSNQRTLREDELSEWSARLIATLTALGGAIRT